MHIMVWFHVHCCFLSDQLTILQQIIRQSTHQQHLFSKLKWNQRLKYAGASMDSAPAAEVEIRLLNSQPRLLETEPPLLIWEPRARAWRRSTVLSAIYLYRTFKLQAGVQEMRPSVCVLRYTCSVQRSAAYICTARSSKPEPGNCADGCSCYLPPLFRSCNTTIYWSLSGTLQQVGLLDRPKRKGHEPATLDSNKSCATRARLHVAVVANTVVVPTADRMNGKERNVDLQTRCSPKQQ